MYCTGCTVPDSAKHAVPGSAMEECRMGVQGTNG